MPRIHLPFLKLTNLFLVERRKSEDITSVIQRFLRQSGLESPLNEYRLMQAWTDVAGPAAARCTRQLYIRNQCLHVSLTSPVLRTELHMSRDQLVEALNHAVGAQVITDIKLQ